MEMDIQLIINGVKHQCIPIIEEKEKVLTEEQELQLARCYEIIPYLNKWKDQIKLIRYLLNNNQIYRDRLVDTMNCSQNEGIEVMSRLSQAACISKRGSYYVKISFCTTVLRYQYVKLMKGINHE